MEINYTGVTISPEALQKIKNSSSWVPDTHTFGPPDWHLQTTANGYVCNTTAGEPDKCSV